MPMTVEQMQAAVDDPDTGAIRRRVLRRQLAGLIAIGPSAPPAPPTEPSRAEQARKRKQIADRHRETVKAELAAVEAHARDVAQRIEYSSSFLKQRKPCRRRSYSLSCAGS